MTTILQHIDWLNGRVPDAVRAQLRQLVAVVGILPHKQPLAVVTADAVLLAANRPFLDLLGVSGDEQLGADWDDFMPGWSARTGSGEESVEPRTLAFEDYLVPAGGDPVWVRVVACPVFTPEEGDAGCEALAAWALFVLDQRAGRREGDERRRRAILDLLLESPNEFVVQLGAQGEVEYLSPSLQRVMGVFADGAEGKPLADVHALVTEDFTKRYSSLLEDLLRPPFRAEFEMSMTTAEGERTIQWRFESLLADGGAVGGVLGVGRDVTERRRAEDERAQSELRLRTLVEATNQLMWTTGPGGVIDRPLESWSAFTGQTYAETRGDGWMDAVHPDDRERVVASWMAAVAEHAVYGCEYRLKAADGEYHWIEARAVPLPREVGEPEYFGVGHDITKRKRAEEAARRRLELESIVATVSTRLAGATLETVDLAVDFSLGETGRCLGADRVSLYLLAPDALHLERVRVWRRSTGLLEDGETSYDLQKLGWVRERAAAGQPVVVHSVDDLPPEAGLERKMLSAMGLDAVLAVPVLQEPTLVGLLTYEIEAGPSDVTGHRWSADDGSLMRLIADQLASLIMWRADELNLRSVADSFLAFGPDVGKNLTQICRAAALITAADVVLYTRQRGRELVTEAGWNMPEGLPGGTPVEGRLDSDVMTRNDEQVHVERYLQDTIYAHTSPIIERIKAHTYAGFPVIVGGRAIGTLSCLFEGDVSLRESQLELLRVLGRAAAVEEERRHAIEDRVLGLAQLEQAMERTVGTLSGAMGTRDPYTAGHEKRVSQLAVAIGQKLGLDNHDLRLLRLAATVHDLGKITVPAEILSKPTRLSEAEFAIIKRHSEAGWELLEPAGLPASVTDAVLQHHERLDGSGYPAGLEDDEIGEFGRIIAVADVVEAMSSHRPYRPAIGVEPALEEIELGRRERYDERAADACLQLFRDEGFAFTE
jgi:PAS domain S-box-containing protein/putative nucleotidyltransferase with HDIG domain